MVAYFALIFKELHRILLRFFARGISLPLCKNKSFSVRPKFWEGGWIEMEKSKRTFRGSYPAYALTYFFFYWSLGVFTSVLSMYLTGIGKSKAEMSFIMSASSLLSLIHI